MPRHIEHGGASDLAGKNSDKLVKLRLPGSIADKLGSAIARGIYPIGHILAGEIEASSELEVSRSAYRESLRILSAKGLVESRPKVGTWVNESSKWHLLDPDVIRWIFSAEPTRQLIEGLFELRMIVEPAAAACAADRRTDAHLETMADALERMAVYTLAEEEGRKADLAFHNALLAATSNPLLTALSGTISAAIQWTSIYKKRGNAIHLDPIPLHANILEAIRRKDTDGARTAMQVVVQISLNETLETRPV